MKFKDLFLFTEQHFDIDGHEIGDDGLPIEPFLNQDDVDDEGGDPAGNVQGLDGENDDVPQPNNPPQLRNRQQGQPPVKKLSETQKIKLKWKEEDPGITDEQMEDAVQFFKQRKETLKPYHPYGYIDPATNRHYINTPEITVLVERFPNMEQTLSRLDGLKDLRNYSWEVMSFWTDYIRNTNRVIEEENVIEGAMTPQQEMIWAQRRWTSPMNRLIDENNTIVYKIECQAEAIALGSIQRLLYEKRGAVEGENVWCVARPLNSKKYGSNLYANYRGGWYNRAFYMVWDKNYPETHDDHMSALQAVKGGGYVLTGLRNDGDNSISWRDVVAKHPVLNGKQNLFPYFGETPKERNAGSVAKITFTPGDQYYFGTLPKSYKRAYIEENRHINNVRAFLTLEHDLRKLYIDMTSQIAGDFRNRFLCDDPNDPFGILEVLRLQRKPEDLYKYLDGFILKEKLKITEGIVGIKKSVIGTNWRRWLSDIDTNFTLISTRDPRTRINRVPKYGMIDVERNDMVKEVAYIASTPRTYMHVEEVDGIKKRKIYIFQRYTASVGDGQLDNNEYFYFLYLKEALTDKASPYYLKGKYYDGAEGDRFIQDQISSKRFIKI